VSLRARAIPKMGNTPTYAEIMETFGELLKTTRVLLKEGEPEEERILPTLAFANAVPKLWTLATEQKKLIAAWEDPAAWEYEAEVFAFKHAGIRPVKVVDGILMLEQPPVYVQVHDPIYYDEWGTEPQTSAGKYAKALNDAEVVVAVYPHPRPASPEQVANLYERALSVVGLSCERSRESNTGSFAVEYREDHLLIVVEHANKPLPAEHSETGHENPLFPHPDRVGGYYKLLMSPGSEFADYLITRKRGPAPARDNLIVASVAFCLRSYGDIKGKKVHKLLNEHVLCETTRESLPEDGSSTSETVQLWRDAKKFGTRLVAASHPLYFSEPEFTRAHNRFSPKKLL
jgi:hypothetical protein